MIYDFFAERDSIHAQKMESLIDYVLAARNLSGQQNQIHKDYMQKEEDKRPSRNHRAISSSDAKDDAKDQIMKELIKTKEYEAFLPPDFSTDLPNSGCCGFHFTWDLKSDFFSRGISEFTAIDNPISRDRLTQCPCLHATGAKGMLRHTFDPQTEQDDILFLFGNDRDNIKKPEDALAGSIVSGDVFFNGKTFAEIISPHNRANRTVKLPVYFEMVNSGTKAEWSLMLFNFSNQVDRIRASVPIILEHVRDLIQEYGMSAKRSSGYGVGKGLKVRITPGKSLNLPDSIKRELSIDDAIRFVQEAK